MSTVDEVSKYHEVNKAKRGRKFNVVDEVYVVDGVDKVEP